MIKKAPSLSEIGGTRGLKPVINEVAEIMKRSLAVDVYLHYREGRGWRVRLLGHPQEWISIDGPWTGLLDALRAEAAPLRAQLNQNERLQERRNQQQRRRKRS